MNDIRIAKTYLSNKLDHKFFHLMEDDEVRVIINSFLDNSLDIIKLVEEKFLDHSDELLMIKNI